MRAELRAARRLLEQCGWVGPAGEPLCRTAGGSPCSESEEGVAKLSVFGALQLSGAYPEGWRALEAVVAPAQAELDRFLAGVDLERVDEARVREFHRLCRAAAGEPHLQAWLQVPKRTAEDVLRVFTTAVLRSPREKTA